MWAFIEAPGDTDPDRCWEWVGNRYRGTTYEYGQLSWGRAAHRVAYELWIGPIPEGLVIDHLCRNTLCVSPFHLEAVTSRTNTMRGFGPTKVNADKTHCIRGHELSGDNLALDSFGRHCRECNRMHARRAWAEGRHSSQR